MYSFEHITFMIAREIRATGVSAQDFFKALELKKNPVGIVRFTAQIHNEVGRVIGCFTGTDTGMFRFRFDRFKGEVSVADVERKIKAMDNLNLDKEVSYGSSYEEYNRRKGVEITPEIKKNLESTYDKWFGDLFKSGAGFGKFK